VIKVLIAEIMTMLNITMRHFNCL